MEPELRILLSQASGVPFYRQITDQVTDLVRSGELPPGTRLPSVRDLAATLLVSLITVRRAYTDLEHAGLIVSKQGQGTFVADDVGSSSRRAAREEARVALAEAVARARRLGLDDDEQWALLRDLLGRGE